MMEGISSLKIPTADLQEVAKAAQRARQGTAPSKERAASAGGGVKAESMDSAQLQALADTIDQTLKKIDGNFSVSYDDTAGFMVVRITDEETGEIVKQIPPQQVLDANVGVEKIIGLLVNDRA